MTEICFGVAARDVSRAPRSDYITELIETAAAGRRMLARRKP